MESFGNSKTTQNRSASRFGKFQELQFNERGRIIGAKTLTFFFDKSRVTEVPRDERNFHAFYALLAGTSIDEKNALHVNYAPDHFFYLNQSKVFKIPDMDDQIAFRDLKASLKSCGFKAKTTMQIFQLLSAILHLGNVQFADTRENSQATQDACSIRNRDVLELVAGMLGVSASKLEGTLTYKLKLIHKELCTVFLNAAGATVQRDSLARALYSVLFAWIVETINTKLCVSDGQFANFVGVLDQFGFQNFKNNTFEQFCINFANERTQQFIINQWFDNHTGMNAIITRDGVSLPTVLTMDNAGCIELLSGKDKTYEKQDDEKAANLGGMIGFLDREAARFQAGASDASDANLLSGFQRQFSTHPSFAKSGQAFAFGINHFAGTVHYSVDSFLEKNLDPLSPDFVNLMRTSSTNSFVSNLFAGSVLATESHPKDDRTIVKAQLPTKPIRAPSMKRPKRRPTADIGLAEQAIPEDETLEIEDEKQRALAAAEEAYKNMEVATVMDQLYLTLRDLTNAMAETRIWHVIHIRPNDAQEANNFDAKRVKAQVRALLLGDIAARKSRAYSTFYTFEEFLARYEKFVGPLNLDASRSDRAKVEAVVTIMGWSDVQAAIGREFIWLAEDEWTELEDGLRAAEKEERARLKGGIAMETDSQFGEGMRHQDGKRHTPATSMGSEDRLLPPRGFGEMGYYDDGASYVSEDEYGQGREGDGSSQYGESEWGGKSIADG